MADVHDKKTRSFNMSRIKGKNTKPEMLVRRFLHAQGFRYRLHDKKLPGKPDIVLPKYKTIVDVRGCFWHNHEVCQHGSQITTPSVEVTKKRETAVQRDEIKEEKWKQLGWTVIVVWADCELEPRKKSSPKREEMLKELVNKIRIENTHN